MRTARLLWLFLMISISIPLLPLANPTLAQYANSEPVVSYSAEVPLLDCNGSSASMREPPTEDHGSWELTPAMKIR